MNLKKPDQVLLGDEADAHVMAITRVESDRFQKSIPDGLQGYIRLHKGTTTFQDKEQGKCTSCCILPLSFFNKCEDVTVGLEKLKDHVRKVKGNGAHNKGGANGKIGWRDGYEKGESLGIYAPSEF